MKTLLTILAYGVGSFLGSFLAFSYLDWKENQ